MSSFRVFFRVTVMAVANLVFMPLPALASVNPSQPVYERVSKCDVYLAQIEYEARYMAGYEAWRQSGGVVVVGVGEWAEFWCDGGRLYRDQG